jgi:hypothetical protein
MAATKGRRSMSGRGRWRRALLAVAALSLAAASQARAYQFGDFLKGAASQLAQHLPATPPPSKPTAPTPAPGATGVPGAMGLQGQSSATPLHKLGTDAVAVVDSAAGAKTVQPMDYVFAGQTFSLGPKGVVTLSYLSGCLTEVISGGTVTVSPTGSRVTGGRLQARATPGCHTARPIILANASEAGATVNRITPFTGVNWDERTLKSGPPVFKWDKALGAAVTIRVKDMDKDGQPVIWQVASTQNWAAYPSTAAPLTPGEPFKAELLVDDKVVASTLFSIDPTLDVSNSVANRVVPLSKS